MSRTSHTNVSIPYYWGSLHSLARQVEVLKSENERLLRERDGLVREMQNIMQAVEQWGYVDISDESDKTTIRLVKEAPCATSK